MRLVLFIMLIAALFVICFTNLPDDDVKLATKADASAAEEGIAWIYSECSHWKYTNYGVLKVAENEDGLTVIGLPFCEEWYRL